MTLRDLLSHRTGVPDDQSYGYIRDPALRRLSMDTLAFLSGIAPAGGINATAEDMARWLRLMLGDGVLDGTLLVSEAGVASMRTPLVATQSDHYGLGLFIEDWHGHRLYSHPGGVPGFGSRCEFLPDEQIGWVVLTNVDDQELPKAVRERTYRSLIARRP